MCEMEKELDAAIDRKHSEKGATLGDVEAVVESKKGFTFDEYLEAREPSFKVLLRDFAVKAMQKAKENGEELALEDALELARAEIPSSFVPEWMQNLRISANIAGTELCAFNEMIGELRGIRELLEVVFKENIDFFADNMKTQMEKAFEVKKMRDEAYMLGRAQALEELSANEKQTEGVNADG